MHADIIHNQFFACDIQTADIGQTLKSIFLEASEATVAGKLRGNNFWGCTIWDTPSGQYSVYIEEPATLVPDRNIFWGCLLGQNAMWNLGHGSNKVIFGVGDPSQHDLDFRAYATIRNPKNYADSTLSGTPKIASVKIDGTEYYFKVYPTKT